MTITDLYELFDRHPVVTTDSRDCAAGSIFIALHGDTFDGNLFAHSALEQGCAAAVVDRPLPDADERYVVVGDTLATLKDLARRHRRRFHIPIVAITGTNGKTTTKELTAAVLSRRYNVLATAGNYNNDIGVPKTLLRLTSAHDIAVIEMGASHPGDIRTLAETAEPLFGLITNVGRAHLQGFGSFQGVVDTKCELYDYLRSAGGTVFVDADNDTLSRRTDGITTVAYGTAGTPSCRVEGEIAACDPLLTFRWRAQGGPWHTVKSHLIGAYNIKNMLSAACIGTYFGVNEDDICAALEGYTPTNSRSQYVVTQHNRLIVDAYNANPSSMNEALRNLIAMPSRGKMAILGDMRELGATSTEEHQRIVDALATTDIADVWLVGSEFAAVILPHPADDSGSSVASSPRFRCFVDADAVRRTIAAEQPRGRLILIKGSNGIRLAPIAQYL